MVDDSRGVAYHVQIVPFRDGIKGDSKQIVFSDDLPNVKAIIEALNSMHWRASANMFLREVALAAQSEIANDLCNDGWQVIRDRGFIEI